MGSPPHMRGKERLKTVNAADDGITPAYAGKSVKNQMDKTILGDHPRICGEKDRKRAWNPRQRGSPPHMRGKGIWWNSKGSATGITPAYAGKSNCGQWRYPVQRDHPRICGEKTTTSRKRPSMQGSPPHMRGKGLSDDGHFVAYRITPAYAGKRQVARV